MKKTIKNKIFTFNLLTVLLLMIITAITFNIAARLYMERMTLNQLGSIASSIERIPLPPRLPMEENNPGRELIFSYVNLIRMLRPSGSIFNVDYAFIDKDNNALALYKEISDRPTNEQTGIIDKILALSDEQGEDRLTFNYNGVDYAAVIQKVRGNNGIQLDKIVIYTNLQKINQMQRAIIIILLGILAIAAVIVLFFSSIISKNISAPLSKLCNHIRNLSERQFSSRFQIPADNEIQELVTNINTMAEKLDSYDKSQKIFLQNASHEFRTPIMSIQSHAEGITYGVVDSQEAARVILEESQRLTHMVEELLYLSRLDTIEENYRLDSIDVPSLLKECKDRLESIASKQQKKINLELPGESPAVKGDFEKLERAVLNLMTNCIRFAADTISIKYGKADENTVEILISDDGPGFTAEDLDNIFTRFYKGRKGDIGLGMAIAKSIIEKHHGIISAGNTSSGAVFRIVLPISG